VANFVNEKVPLERVALDNYVSTENILPGYGGVTKASRLPTTGSVTRYRPNDTLVSNIRPYLKKVWVADKEGGASNDVIVIRAKQSLLPQYFSCLLKNDAFIDYVMTGAKGVKMPRGDIASMKAYPTLYPTKPEQQKIADCLSSLDELIATQGRKVDALKIHKKGLMQQLFPREGETQPRLRFPEFRGAGEWDSKALKEVFSIFQGFAFSSNDSVKRGCRWLKIADVGIQVMNHDSASFLPADHSERFVKFSVKEGDYVIALTRPILSGQLKIAQVDEIFDGALLNQRVGKLITAQYPAFVFFLLQSWKLIDDIEKSISGNDPPNLSAQQIEGVKTYIPRLPEQQRIADCLASVDDIIAAQVKRLDALNSYKKGLVQQLFPSPVEVTE
jgi:type I restriction enzyme S subunit